MVRTIQSLNKMAQKLNFKKFGIQLAFGIQSSDFEPRLFSAL